jgi:DUF4097 and DUF4098 domain-containing protein YvlB
MTCHRRAHTLIVFVVAVFMVALSTQAADHRGAFTEEFHQTYAITPDGRVELDNINGPVHISAWDQNEVKVDAVKYASSKERLDEARIEVDSGKDYLSIRTRYPDHDHTFDSDWDNPASVEYTLTVPRTVRLDEIKLTNGSLDVAGVTGEVHASCVNGHLEAHNLAGRTELSTVNGRMVADFEQLPRSTITLHTVNGSVELTIPSDSSAEIEAGTVSGSIENDFGLHVSHGRYVGHSMHGQLADGATHIDLKSVNGRLEIRHAADGKTLSPVKDLGHHDNGDDSDI